MPRTVRTARGVILDFDTIIIKQQLAQAPMNIEVARRKEFIDSKEGKVRGAKQTEVAPTIETTAQPEAAPAAPVETATDVDAAPAKTTKKAKPTK